MFEVTVSLPLTARFGNDEDRILVDKLQAEMATKGISFSGHEFGENSAVLYFETSSIATVLNALKQQSRVIGLLHSATVRFNDDTCGGDQIIRIADIDKWLKDADEPNHAKRPKSHKPKVGDYYAVPLPDGRFAHCAYVFRDPDDGDIVRVLNAIRDHPEGLEVLQQAKDLFPPIKVSVKGAIRSCGWLYRGHLPPDPCFKPPVFRNSLNAFFRFQPGVYSDWYLDYGRGDHRFVGRLNDTQRLLEYGVTWSVPALVERILTGLNPYAEMK